MNCTNCLALGVLVALPATKFYNLNGDLQASCSECFDCVKDLFIDYGYSFLEISKEEYSMDEALS